MTKNIKVPRSILLIIAFGVLGDALLYTSCMSTIAFIAHVLTASFLVADAFVSDIVDP